MHKGRIIVTYGANVNAGELSVAKILVSTGFDVKFLPVSVIKRPDILFLGREWEIKSPIGSTVRTVENILRRAVHQSSNIILDLRRIKLSEQKCLAEIARQMKMRSQIKNVLVINRSGQMIDKFCTFEIIEV